MLFLRLSKKSEAYWDYNTISLKLFIEIAQGSHYHLLVRQGAPDHEKCLEAWEAIVKRNSAEAGSQEYSNYFNLVKAYALLIAKQISVKSSLLKLTVTTEWEDIVYLRGCGYNIDTTTTLSYWASLESGLRKSEDLLNKIKMKQFELEAIVKGRQAERSMGFEETIANLITGLGFSVDDNISLARFNEYRKLIKKKAEAVRSAKERFRK